MSQDPNLWYVRGTIHNADGTVFHNQGRILAYHMFPQGGWQWIAESDIDSNTGAFELVFHKDRFQEVGSPEADYPTLQIRVTDYEYNPLWMSCIYTTPPHELYMGDIVVNGDINENWTVCGNVYYSSKVPFTNGYVKVFDVRNGAPLDLGFCQLNAVGFYSVSYTKAQFQQGDTSITSPNLLVRVYSADGVNVANQAGPAIASAREFINIKVESGDIVIPDGSCRIYGSVVNKLGRPVSGVKITAYCLHYDITDINNHPTGTFVHQELGVFPTTGTNGEYSISYKPEILPQGLLLDAEDAYGKNKVSLYAKLEIYETGASTPKITVFKPLVFNGKREQRIDFEIDLSSTTENKSLFEELDSLLAIYRETVTSGSTYLTDRRNKIDDFLKNVDEFPLVVGREHRTDKEVRAYFLAYSLYYGLLGRLEKTENEYSPEKYAQGIFALTYQELVENLDDLVNIAEPALQTALFDASTSNYISASDVKTEDMRNLWETATMSSAVVNEMEDQFSPYHIFYLFLKEDLVQENVYVDGVLTSARINLPSLTGNDKQKIDSLMIAFYNAGCDYGEMISNLKKQNSTSLTDDDITRLQLLIDLCNFGDWYSDFVVAAYKYAIDPTHHITELKDFLSLEEAADWDDIVDEVSTRYKKYYPKDSLGLPHEFPGNTEEEQKILYTKKLKDLIVSWFPQYKLYSKLASALSGDAWANLFRILGSEQWEGFSLIEQDSKKYEEEHIYAEKITDETTLNKLHILQRIFRLTDDVDAVAYLINNGFESATSIAQLDEDYFVAEHALGIGTKEQATQIHRVAKSFMAEATFTIGQFHRNLNENGKMLPPTSRGVTPNLTVMAAGGLTRGEATRSNVALPRIPAAISPTWKNLFGNINRNGATEGQSVLSASAYFVDLLNFFKANEEPYKRFHERRSDLLNLELTKANAEVAMPTIDLVNELLECLAGHDDRTMADIVANQTPSSATVASLRAEPLKWEKDGEGETRQTVANQKLMTHAYPAMLPLNTYRTKATKLLANIPLTFYSMSESLGREATEKNSLFADELLHKILFKENFSEPWTSWGLTQKNNNVYFPDKSEYKMDNPSRPTPYLKNMDWDDILRHVSILLDRAGITFKELQELLALPPLARYHVNYHCPDALQYQLADINGYVLFEETIEGNNRNGDEPVGGDRLRNFFIELAAFIRFRRLLGWSFADIALRYDELNRKDSDEGTPENASFPYAEDPLCNWDRVQEMVLRFGITPLNSLAWYGFALTEDELETVFDVPVLFKRYREPKDLEDAAKIEKYDDEYIENDIAKAAASCLSLKKEDVLYFLEQSGIFTGASTNEAHEQHEKFLNGLNYVYRYGTFAQKHNLTADELYLLQDAGLGSLDDVRDFSLAIRKCQGTSLPISVIEDLIRKPDDSVTKKAEAFMGVSQKNGSDEIVLGSLYTSIAESWNAVKIDEKDELNDYPDETEPSQEQTRNEEPQDGEEQEEESEIDHYANYVIAYKDACSKILLSLGYEDVPYIDLISQALLPIDEDDLTVRTNLESWLNDILQEVSEQIEDVLDKQKTPIQRLYKFYGYLKPVWIEKQVYTMLSQEFGIAADERAQDAFKALLVKVATAAIEVWTNRVKNTLWPSTRSQATTSEIDYVAYYALYKANILYQYVSDYVLNSIDAETGLALGFGWTDWNELFNYQIIDKDERLYLLSNITPYSVFESLIEAYSVSDAFGNKEYSYAAVPPVDEDSSNTPIETLRDLKKLLLVPQDVFERCYVYAFEDSNLIEIEQDGQTVEVFDWDKECGWNSIDCWHKFFKVYQLYLKTFTTPEILENLFIELTESDLSGGDNFEKLENAVQELNDNLNANYSESEWHKFIQGVSDEIRKERRDALAGFVCWESQTTPKKYPQSFLNTNDLYAYYLIDVLMEPDMSMSRIVQANACLQLFVQRCQLGLEGQTVDGANLFSDSALSQWEWMKNYQVWVANRKVFLYPENWLDVSLRDDKSSFFTELEERLQEVGGDSDDMERIYAEYLEKMRETANLEIVGCCKEDGDPNGETVYTLHIIGRTRGEPHRYYYRKYFAKKNTRGTWSPWELIEADITGDVVFPQLMNGRLYLVWPQYTQGQRQLNSGTTNSDDGVCVPQLEFYVEIKMAWTCFNGKKWAGIKTSKNALYDISNDSLDFKLEKDEKIADRYHFKLSQDNGCINVNVYRTLLDQFFAQDYQNLATYCWGEYAKTQNEYYKNEAMMYEALYADGISKEVRMRLVEVTAGTYIKQVVENRFSGNVGSQKISYIGFMTISYEGRDSSITSPSYARMSDIFRFGEGRGTPTYLFSPNATYLKHNYWFSNGKQPLVYKQKEILSAQKEFRILPVNMDFYDPEDETGHVSDLPFFYMDSTNTYFVCPKANKGNKRVYEFILMSHPIMDEFFNQYRNGGKKELHTRGIQALEKVQSYYTMYSGYNYYFGSAIGYHIAGDWAAWDMGQSFFESNYCPTYHVTKPYPAPYVDFSWNSPNGIYNWELFFYVPVRIADKLIAEEKYEAALEWLQLVFDPQGKKEGPEKIARWADDLPSGAQYWRFLPFYANPDADKTILESLAVLEESDNSQKKTDLQCLIEQWKFDPFEPHLIAKQRLVAYQKFVVMKYLNTLIARGDELFTQDTTESVNLAIQFYIMAADILGPKSAEAPDPLTDEVRTADELIAEVGEDGNLEWANTLLEYEDSMLIGRIRDRDTYQNKYPYRTSLIANISKQTFYFNVPRNENLMAFWETVADRLYKIRNSLNIEGIKRTLALFAPPIDPGMLVKARAAGLSISDILADSGAALPHYRFKVIVAKALEIARDLRNMQETLLQALKDKDSEALAQLRMQHRIAAKKLSQSIFEIQMKELETEASSLEVEKEKKTKKQEHHKSNVEKLKTDFENGYAKTMQKVADLREKVESAKRIASAMYSIPDLDAGGIVNAFGGIDFHMAAYGGRKLGEAALTMAESYLSKALEREAAALQQKAKGEEKKAAEEETFEESIATNEIDQTEKAIVVNTIRQEQNEKEQELFEKELERDEEEYEFLCDKFTNKDLHEWLVKQMTKLSKTMCKLTTKVAKMAEKCYHFEIGDTDMGNAKSFISNSYWDGAYSGLLSADRLIADLHAMEVAYLENDKREQEITWPVSLKTLKIADGEIDAETSAQDVSAILQNCSFEIKTDFICNELGISFCRIRDVRLRVVAPGFPGLALNAKLTLESNTLKYNGNEIQNRIGVCTFATGMANSDCGKFDFNFKSEKFASFEGAGLDSSWNLTIGEADGLSSIDDVILYISFTAKNS
ncbi:neuraminidase-like domain-containing protein [Fibrobacter sp.]|uniref:Tc toxin subunit A-related protein n=1 Tax=Fibrobacter sp. TaxID=35828 RepID=UPI002630E152|nr:neuraminidase-like domain-containing protein [Fibrobacter sp.]MDD5943502.1 neuraminidase-like domain-containing protein [Fibrobacter sp.]